MEFRLRYIKNAAESTYDRVNLIQSYAYLINASQNYLSAHPIRYPMQGDLVVYYNYGMSRDPSMISLPVYVTQTEFMSLNNTVTIYLLLSRKLPSTVIVVMTSENILN